MNRITDYRDIEGLTIKSISSRLDGYIIIFEEDTYIYITASLCYGDEPQVILGGEPSLYNQLKAGVVSPDEYTFLINKKTQKEKERIKQHEIRQLRRLTKKYPEMLKEATDAKK